MHLLPTGRRIYRDLERAWHSAFGKREMVMPVLDYEHYWELQSPTVGNAPLEREVIIAEHIEDDSTVLDIGCGVGRFLAYLRDCKTGIRCSGIDVSGNAVQLAIEKGLDCSVVDVTSSDFEVDQVYDYIVLSEVIEHLPNPEALLLKLKAKYRKALFVTIPNIGYYPHRLRLLVGSFPVQTVWHPGEHLRYWTVSDFKEWMSCLGFRVEKSVASNGFPGLAHLMPNLFGLQIVFMISSDGLPAHP